ncbi:acyl-CoA thioesterase [Conexibacter sp. DBS9H8]|uniref:acyl-CoA thioesterase n=1 Tax=Conexibacter sp. DBS9H8 TaxID=2937801 RepID=UPI0035316A4E
MTPPLRYRYHRSISLRWKDNDVYGHVNNVEYYAFFDTVINEFLVLEAGLDIHAGPVIGVCAESRCRFHASVAFPGVVRAGLCVEHLGRSSVRYGIGLSEEVRDGDAAAPASAHDGDEHAPAETRLLAEGSFVHVFVDRERRRPAPIPATIREALEQIRAPDAAPTR